MSDRPPEPGECIRCGGDIEANNLGRGCPVTNYDCNCRAVPPVYDPEKACGDCPIGGREGGGPVCPNVAACDHQCAEQVEAMRGEHGPCSFTMTTNESRPLQALAKRAVEKLGNGDSAMCALGFASAELHAVLSAVEALDPLCNPNEAAKIIRARLGIAEYRAPKGKGPPEGVER